MLAPGSDSIPVELLQILTQYAICQLPEADSIFLGFIGRYIIPACDTMTISSLEKVLAVLIHAGGRKGC